MSHWNNSYVYNDRPQDSTNWTGDVNNHSQYYVNQEYYPNRQYEPTNQQYVNFNEFLSQMQNSAAAQSNGQNYNAVQYQNYGQYDYQNMPSTSQNAQIDTYYASNTTNLVNGAEGYRHSQYEAQPMAGAALTNELILNSNLTPTATEFVPKQSSGKPSTSAQNVPESTLNSGNNTNNGPVEYKKSHGSSSDTNWRQRPQSSKQNEDPKHNKYEGNNRYLDNRHQDRRDDRQSDRREDKDRQSDRREDRDRQSDRREDKDRQSDRREDRDRQSDRREDRDRQSDRREDRDRHVDRREERDRQIDRREDRDRHGDRREDRDRQNDRRDERDRQTDRREDRDRHGDRREERDRQMDRREDRDRQSDRREERDRQREDTREYGNRNRDRNRYYDSNSYNYDNSRSERNQSKSNAKSNKNKDPDARTFYNSSINKGVQEPRNGKGEGSGRNRNWAGSQRLRAVERNFTEDEQYANNYMQYREERAERMGKQDASSPKYRGKQTFTTETVHTEMTQRERLSEQLDKGTLECLVCCERVKQIDPVWSCSNCYHVLHLRCIRKWAISSVVEGKWRCPACQNTSEEIPTEYRCMCGAARSPEYLRGGSGAHTCGRACKRPRACPHPCTLLCHPGPCPPCQATVNKQCGCGAETRMVLCSSKLPQVCGRVCGRALDCGVHTCQRDCHEGECDACTETVTQVCYCTAEQTRSVPCTRETGTEKHWSCGSACSRVLACGAHVCRRGCHAPPCAPCRLLPRLVLTCPCGHTQLDKDCRKSCTDPIPLCGNICAKPLSCGPAGDKHFCKLDCHEGDCPVCPDKTVLQCRCGHSSREVPCADLPEMYNNVLCQKKCNKKLSCGRHRCRTVCCSATSHRCAVVCGRTLSCQLHRCEEFCHTGHCAPCPRVSFEELHCTCGAQVLMPPVRCGARPPPCDAPCRARRPCGHEPHHSCHQGDCPPCVVLTTKRCHGQHEERKTIPCSQEEFSCGLPCGKPLPCGKHTCIKTCHKGECDAGKCTQPCNEKRPSCGHPCAAPCHSGTGAACPSAAPCRRPVRATCACGRRASDRPCTDNARDYAKMMSALAATKMQEGGSVDLSDVQRPGSMLKTLECDDECRVEQRTRQMALALQIRNPDVSAKLAPRYSDTLRATAAREPAFAQQIHDRLTELVHLAKKSKQKTRAHSFPSMNWQKRQFIHELCEHFGCESVAYDAEPNRNVVATADKEKSWLPAMSVLEVVAREAGKRRVPGPVLRAPPAPSTAPAQRTAKPSGWATLTSTNAWAARSNRAKPTTATATASAPASASTSTTAAASAAPPEKIDYFNNPPEY